MTKPSRIPATRRTLLLLPGIPDDATEDIKNGLAIRNACITEGKCPDCGAEPYFTLDPDGITHLVFEHEYECAVVSDQS